ncbi:hypothetical protein E2C01_096087 [Portunus trituberculatus]|uniref:Uncharacterized protein n=1 Tax=Portunus trituberculatus TaxID=210409 RepID=A0A5B7K7C9_PORTR|nr:hypothetical protein [Portunus trituberculatus]
MLYDMTHCHCPAPHAAREAGSAGRVVESIPAIPTASGIGIGDSQNSDSCPPLPPRVLTRHSLSRQPQVLRHTLLGHCHSLVQGHHILGCRSRQLLPWRPPGREI